ncbi:MAG: DUF2384 domain-containing protein [Verrucomicrobia bacterium]|nr:DUF2384 domain-containing protein [Verrucomicrobiota bacterium]
MINEIDLLKAQAEALGAYLKLQDGLTLRHSQCLDAIAATNGHRDWGAVAAKKRSALGNQEIDFQSHSSMEDQAARLRNHLVDRSGFTPSDSTEAIAATRWGALVEQPNQILGNPVAVSNWLRQPHPQLGGRTPHELIDTDAGYQQIERLLHEN